MQRFVVAAQDSLAPAQRNSQPRGDLDELRHYRARETQRSSQSFGSDGCCRHARVGLRTVSLPHLAAGSVDVSTPPLRIESRPRLRARYAVAEYARSGTCEWARGQPTTFRMA